MRIMFFNIWHGTLLNELEKYIRGKVGSIDIFCFLETDSELQAKLTNVLPNFSPYFYPGIKTDYLGGVREGRSIFVRENIKVLEFKKIKLFQTHKRDAGGMLFARLGVNGKDLYIGSVHGKARPGTKLDTPIRIKQSEKIIDYFKNIKGPKIIGGDFNLNPDTKSIQMFEKAGYRNLIKNFGIKNTRNQVSWKNFDNVQHFADYVFVSPKINVKKFNVPYNEVSDHLPQILEFDF